MIKNEQNLGIVLISSIVEFSLTWSGGGGGNCIPLQHGFLGSFFLIFDLWPPLYETKLNFIPRIFPWIDPRKNILRHSN
jgi:hypothetical protein